MDPHASSPYRHYVNMLTFFCDCGVVTLQVLVLNLGPQLLPLRGLICPCLGIPQMKAVMLLLLQYHRAANGLLVLGYLPQI